MLLIAYLLAVIPAVAVPDASAAAVPSLTVSHNPRCESKIKALAALAGPGWREVAEKNRKPELKYLSKAQIIALMQKYADKETGDVGGEPLDEMPEIAEASFRAGDFCFPTRPPLLPLISPG